MASKQVLSLGEPSLNMSGFWHSVLQVVIGQVLFKWIDHIWIMSLSGVGQVWAFYLQIDTFPEMIARGQFLTGFPYIVFGFHVRLSRVKCTRVESLMMLVIVVKHPVHSLSNIILTLLNSWSGHFDFVMNFVNESYYQKY